ncbi:MAG: DUF1501 domain-containing protein [Acidobacteria bacterium]|nr:DUF1501 domain-containing protein [Acidobacteriota bacterium]
MRKNRRDFLKSCCQLGAAGITAHLAHLAPITAQAQVLSDYKALVCIFLFGGNDSNNLIVPIDSRYAAYRTMRGPVALDGSILLPAGGSGFGFHPSLANIQRLYTQQHAAAVFNVGTLFQPVTKSTLDTSPLPRNLYSHSDQTQQWQSADPNGGGTGWGGRLNDHALLHNTGALPPGITVNGGNALFLAGQTTRGLNFSNAGSYGLSTFGDSTSMAARLTSLQKVLTFDTGLQLVSAANGVLGESIRSAQEINAALNSAPALPVQFPNSSLGDQLAQVAQIIAVRGDLGMNRQIFFAGLGGFDTHEDLLARHAELMTTLDAAVGAFVTTLEQRGVLGNVTVFTESEFNRTANPNANNGTDHAWGSHHLVLGGAVAGGVYGTFPTHELRGPDDAGDRGDWIPTTGLDQYAATLARWFDVPEANLNLVFPNLANFSPQTLGFV